jgi:FkbM family methyltransferase
MSRRARALNRVVGGVSRRLGRPELLAAVDPSARRAQQEDLAIRAVLASSLRGDGVYVDVGTNRGQVLGEAVRIAPRVRHVAFEPIPQLADEVERAFPGVEVRRRALGEEQGQAEFCHFRRLDGWSGLRRQQHISDERGDPEFITVDVSTLDGEIRQDASVVKIDVEGAELAVLRGGRALLSRTRPLLIFEHVPAAAALYGADSGSLWDLLTELDYEVFSVTGSGPFGRSEFAHAEGLNWLGTPRRRADARGASG